MLVVGVPPSSALGFGTIRTGAGAPGGVNWCSIWDVAQTAGVVAVAGVVALKPPWNQPQVMPLAFNRSPTFLPLVISTVPWPVLVPPASAPQSSSAGSVSLVSVDDGLVVPITPNPENVSAICAKLVLPETRLMAPTDDGPYIEP